MAAPTLSLFHFLALIALLGLLASTVLAQPHGHAHRHAHNKRGMEIEWITETQTVTVFVDDTTTVTSTPSTPTTTETTTSAHAQFIESEPTSSTPKPPKTTSTPEYVPPTTPKVVEEPQPTTKAAPAAPTVQGGSGAPKGNIHKGDVTFFDIGLGACGEDHSGQDNSFNLVALSAQLMGAQSNGNPFCGRTITIKGPKGTTTAVVKDKCPECDSDSIDISMKAFKEIYGSLDVGRGPCEWYFN